MKRKIPSDDKPILKMPKPLTTAEKTQVELQQMLDVNGLGKKINAEVTAGSKRNLTIAFKINALPHEMEKLAHALSIRLFNEKPSKSGKPQMEIEGMDSIEWLDKERQRREERDPDEGPSRR